MGQPVLAGRAIAAGAACAPLPAWAAFEPYDIPATPNPHFVAGGLCVLLEESQIDLCGPDRAWTQRRAEMVTASAGAERAAQFETSFDPAFERVEIHSIHVLRGAQVIDYTETAVFDALRRERNMERLLFDGRITITCTLPDIRTGDVVETVHTRYGVRKSLGGRLGAWIPFEWTVGIIDVRVSLRAPANRAIALLMINGAPEPVVSEANGVIEKKWRSVERPAIRYEQLAPPWVAQNAAVQLSEWRDWGEVAAMFAPLYDESGLYPDDLNAEIKRIEETETTSARRAAAILRFVQGGVRYLAIAIGEGGYTPRSLADICATRYGDCKDKAKLFVAMARRLGVNACPVLVNTMDGRALDSWLPSGVVFDHCIVRVEIDGKIYWLDGARSLQPSPLDAMSQSHFGWALPLRPGVTALERMAEPSLVHAIDSAETVTLGGSMDTAVRYEWRISSRRGRAEFVRDQIAREGQVGLFKTYTQDIQRTWPKAKPLRQTLDKDDVAANVVTVREVYEISDAWAKEDDKVAKFATLDLVMRPVFAPLNPGERKYPIYLGQISRTTRRVEISTETPWRSVGWDKSIECSAVSYKNKLTVESQRNLVIEQSLEIRALTLPAAEAEKYRAIVADLEHSDVLMSEGIDKNGNFVLNTEKQRVARQRDTNNMRWIWWLVRLGILAGAFAARYLAHPG